MDRPEPLALHEDRVADLRARWTPEATAAAVAFLESRPLNYDLPKMVGLIEKGRYGDLVGVSGDPLDELLAIHDALAFSKTPFAASAPSSNPTSDSGIDTKQLDQTLAQSGKLNGVVYQFSIARAEKTMDNGMEVPASMGLATAINFQPTGSGKAAITGDFVLVGSEVNPVIKALRENGIEVTALHSHMLTETPRLFFMHFWANDDAQKLAHGLRAALDKMNIVKAH